MVKIRSVQALNNMHLTKKFSPLFNNNSLTDVVMQYVKKIVKARDYAYQESHIVEKRKINFETPIASRLLVFVGVQLSRT